MEWILRRRQHLLIGGVLLVLLWLALEAVYVWRRDIPLHWRTGARAWVEGIDIDHGLRLRMADGVELAASLYLPAGDHKQLPTVYVRLPYGRKVYGEGMNFGMFFARQGYAVLVQDIRGKHDSGGLFSPWQGSTADGAATLDWITAQPWSNGKVGTIGCSALGELQYTLARARHPALAAMVPIDAGGAWARDPHFGFYEGGVLQLGSALGWFLDNGQHDPHTPPPQGVAISQALKQLPVSGLVARHTAEPNAYAQFVGRALEDPQWRVHDFVHPDDTIDVPALTINTWYDQSLDGALALAAQNRSARQHMILAPGTHCQHEEVLAAGRLGDLPLGPGATQPYRDWYARWFDHWLRGQPDALADLPRYLFYVLNEDRWLSAASWPPEQAVVQHWHVSSAGAANGRSGNGVLSLQAPTSSERFDELVDDPASPVPSRGGPVCCTGDPSQRAGPVDQVEVEQRQDVLVYTSAPLQRPLRIAGPIRLRLDVSSTAVDTDVVARLTHVWPDGRSTSIQEGALRLQYRDGFDVPRPLVPGQRHEVTVNLRSIAYLVPAGHRLRLQVAGSSFPRLERNLHGGGDNRAQSRPIVARTRVHHGGGAVSALELPTLDTMAQAHGPGALTGGGTPPAR